MLKRGYRHIEMPLCIHIGTVKCRYASGRDPACAGGAEESGAENGNV